MSCFRIQRLITALLVGLSRLLAAAAIALAPAARSAEPPPPAETPAARDARMAWWREARFGMFIHWGVYAVPARRGEWVMHNEKIPVATYRAYARDFNPVKYDPAAWARIARDAGMGYMVITAKHHEGFALYPSGVTDWDIADATPYGKDLLGPLVDAAHAAGLKCGFYYSQAQDWVHPGGAKQFLEEGGGWDEAHKGSFDGYLEAVALPQVRELLTGYAPDIFWWDTPDWMTPERAAPVAGLLALRPGILSNNRLGGGFRGDFATPEHHIPVVRQTGDWETCMTLGDNWGYVAKDTKLKSVGELVRKLAEVVSKGGNLLLNVGPTPEGEIPAGMVERLEGVGRWMKANGESIRGASGGPFANLTWGCATRRDRRLYLHVFRWPADGLLRVPLRSGAAGASLLGQPGKALPFAQADGRITIILPVEAPDAADSVVVLDLAEEPVVAPSPTANAKATASASQAGGKPQDVFDGTDGRRWLAPEGVKSAWLETDLGGPMAIAGFAFDQPRAWPRLKQSYTLAVEEGSGWREIARGRTMGHGGKEDFPPVTARRFRLTLELEEGAPGVTELEFYRAE